MLIFNYMDKTSSTLNVKLLKDHVKELSYNAVTFHLTYRCIIRTSLLGLILQELQ